MSESTVRLFDLETQKTTKIPARELAPGMVRAVIGGVGEVWVDSRSPLISDDGPVWHPPLGEEVRETLRRLQATFRDVFPRTLEEWENGFRQELLLEQELAAWVVIADAFEHFTAGRALSYEEWRDTFQVILTAVSNGRDHVVAAVAPVTLAREQIEEILDFVFLDTGGNEAGSTPQRAMSFSGDSRPDERLVQLYEAQFRAGVGVPRPILVRQANGRCFPLDADAAARVEAARRCGALGVEGIVIDDPGHERLEALRRAIAANRLNRG
jgi:hypothetical protein